MAVTDPTPPDGAVLLPVRPRRVLWIMLAIAAALTAITVVVHLLEPIQGRPPDSPYQQLLALPDAASEISIANWYSALVLLACAGLMAWIGHLKRRAGEGYSRRWLGLAIIFLVLSLDEGVGIHDAFADPMREAFDLGGVLYWGWVLPWGALTIVCALAYIRFMAALRPGVRGPIIAAAALFVGAALGLELAEGELYTSGGVSLSFEAALIIEEFAEMAALALLAYGLLRQLVGDRGGALRIDLVPTTATDEWISRPRFRPAGSRGRRWRRSSARSASR